MPLLTGEKGQKSGTDDGEIRRSEPRADSGYAEGRGDPSAGLRAGGELSLGRGQLQEAVAEDSPNERLDFLHAADRECGGGAAALRAPQPVDGFTGHPRVAILSDIGNEPDDQMSFVRLMLYSNELDLEAMIATTSVWQKTATHPETMQKIIATYGEVRPHLLENAPGWPEASALDSRVVAGQAAYGMAATGEGKDSAGAQALLRAMERDDARPLWISVWGGANTLAQALMDLRATQSAEETARIVGRLRVYASSDQDDAGAWIRREFPGLLYIVTPSTQDSGDYYAATWTGISGDVYYRNGEGADTSLVTNEWLDRNVRAKGPLGKMYPRFMFIMEGDTPTFLNLIDNGLNGYRRPDWGGWGGRYVYRQPRGETRPIWTQGGDEFARATSQDEVHGHRRQDACVGSGDGLALARGVSERLCGADGLDSDGLCACESCSGAGREWQGGHGAGGD